ncbi:MAG: hypothetical protein ACK5V5_13235 [Cyclobacteriaceae bacterium]|jgi:uncharacterized membrane protein YqjE|nr:hypothetical protein [Flammeovirgaceae bacterium]
MIFPGYGWFSILFLLALTGALVFMMVRLRSRQPDLFPLAYLGSIAVKMLLSLTYLVVIVIDNPTEAMANAVVFLLAYLSFTGLELWWLLRATPR